MLLFLILIVPAITALINRLWRGEGMVPKFIWYVAMISMATGVFYVMNPHATAHQMIFLAMGWFIYCAAYATTPKHSLFSAIHGRPPTREDSKYIRWAQEAACMVTNVPPIGSQESLLYKYDRFGIAYGVFVSLPMLVAIAMITYYSRSYEAVFGSLCLLAGVAYYWAGWLSQHFTNNDDIAIALAELVIGWWHGTYMLLVSIGASNT